MCISACIIYKFCPLLTQILASPLCVSIVIQTQVDTGIDLGFPVKGGWSISLKKKNHVISHKYLFSINKQSIKKNTQNLCFVIHYNAIIY